MIYHYFCDNGLSNLNFLNFYFCDICYNICSICLIFTRKSRMIFSPGTLSSLQSFLRQNYQKPRLYIRWHNSFTSKRHCDTYAFNNWCGIRNQIDYSFGSKKCIATNTTNSESARLELEQIYIMVFDRFHDRNHKVFYMDLLWLLNRRVPIRWIYPIFFLSYILRLQAHLQ